MNTMYKTYERFLDAAKKFPRWSNVRRRPNESVGGHLLQNIVEEIGKIEDAIIEYKKDFFIVNYIGREEDIVDYLYNVQIGSIEDINNLKIVEPALFITDDLKTFYKNSSTHAYYQDGYLILRKEYTEIVYVYNEFTYKVKPQKFHIWNIFDEFAWWVGLERFDDETNKQLLNRAVNQFHDRPNSSEQGLKNVIKNAVSPYGNLDDDEIIIETPTVDNLYTEGDLYEEISQFNRDIARTKQWDIDYWDNKFRTLKYIPHKWDEPVKIYKDGVGYNDSLFVSSVKDLNETESTNVTINGYKKSVAKIEEYVKNKNISKDIELKLKRYNDIINPITVQYKIEASTLTPIDNPKNFYIDAYITSNQEKTYSLDSLYESKDSGVNIINRKILEENKEYTLKLYPKTQTTTMEIEQCALKDASGSTSLLKEQGSFVFDRYGNLVHKAVAFHGDSVADFNSYSNLINYRYGGVILENAMTPGQLEIDISEYAKVSAQPLIVETECEPYDIMSNPTYIMAKNFTLVNGNYISNTSSTEESSLTIELLCRDLFFETDKGDADSLKTAIMDIETYINGKLNQTYCYYNVSASSFKGYSLKQYKMNDVKVVISKRSNAAIKVSRIRTTRYETQITTSEGMDISPTVKESVTIPVSSSENYYLYVTVNNYGQYAPIIKSVHIGSKLNSLTATYSINFDTKNKRSPELLLKSNCDYELIDKLTNKKVDYYPENDYYNAGDEPLAVYLDLSNFKKIYDSNPVIQYASDGKAYILIPGNTTMNSIVIYGDSEQLQSRTTLDKIFDLQLGDNLFVNKKVKGIIKKSSDKEELLYLTEAMCSDKSADTYNIWCSDFSDLVVCYISNAAKNAESINNKYIGHFNSVYFYSKNSVDYIAYNYQNIIKNVTDNISIVKSFLPAIPASEKVLYYIEDFSTYSLNDFEIVFTDGNRWATSDSKKIVIKTDLDLNSAGVINTTEFSLTQTFGLSNNIALQDSYTINNEIIELGKYILTVPDDMNVIYDEITLSQSKDEDGGVMYVEEDGFNKLTYSNIARIDSLSVNDQTVAADKYSLLNEEGIICWNDDSLIGQRFTCRYTYKKPRYLVFKNLDMLYELVGYYVDTMERVKTINDYVIKNAVEGTIINVDYNYFIEKPDNIVAQCDNPCYTGIFNNDSILIQKIADDNSIVIHNGYYYINGKEYWYFADRLERDTEKVNGVEIKNVEEIDDELHLKQEATNYLKNSKMLCNHMDVHCIIDFNYYRNIPNLSSLNHIGICDSFGCWHSYKMNVGFSNEVDGHSIKFSAEDSSAYAILDITHALQKARFIACQYEGSLEISLGREIKIMDQALSKTLYLERYQDFEKYKDKYYFNGQELDPLNYRYYIIVQGSGTLAEILVTEDNNIETAAANFNSNIARFGLSIQEEAQPSSLVELDYSPIGNTYNNLELTKDLVLQTGTTADWGITKLYEWDLSNINRNGFTYRGDSLVSDLPDAYIETEPYKVDRRNAVLNLFVKINDFAYGDLKDFDVVFYGSTGENGEYLEIGRTRDQNMAYLSTVRLKDYIKIRVIAKTKDKVINHLEVFAQFRETQNASVPVEEYTYGDCVSKVYNLATDANYRLKEVIADETDPENISYYVRGIRQGDEDLTMTAWSDIKANHIFERYHLFQFKTELKSAQAKTRIKKFIFEVVE